MIEAIRFPSRSAAVLMVAACLAGGIILALWPPMAMLAFLGALTLAALSATGRPFLGFFILFIVFQDPLRFLIANDDSPAGILIKRLDEVMLFTLGIAALTFQVRVHRVLQETRLMLTLATIYAGVILSSFVAHTSLWPSLMDFALFSKPFLLFFLGVAAAPSDLEFKRVTPWVILGMSLVVLFGLVFLVYPGLRDAYIGAYGAADERVGMVSAQGFFEGAGGYSWFCAASFALAYAAYLCYERTVYLVAAIVDATFVLLAWRRKSIAAVLLMVMVALLVRSGRWRVGRTRTIVLAGLAITAATMLLTPYIGALWDYTMKEYGGTNPYSNARLALHYVSVLIAIDHFPLGTGLASFGSHASRVYYSDVYGYYGISNVVGLSQEFSAYVTDTFWPMVLGEGGVISFVAYVSLFALFLKAAWRLVQRVNQTREARFVALMAMFLLVGSLAESTSSPTYCATIQAALVMIPVGVMWERFSSGGSEHVAVGDEH